MSKADTLRNKNIAEQFLSSANSDDTEDMAVHEEGSAAQNDELLQEIARLKKELKEAGRPQEKRSKQVALLIRPSLLEQAKKKAKKNKQSFNDYVHRLIEQDIEGGIGS